MSRFPENTLILLLAAAPLAHSQVTIGSSYTSNGPVTIEVTPNPRPMPAITGLPWSGVQNSERILLNGTHMDQASTRTFRDSRGRTRVEHSGPTYGSATIIEINDPVNGHTWVLDPVNQIAHRLALASHSKVGSHTLKPCAAGGEITSRTMPDGATSVTETLGSKTIEGITACGSRNSITRKGETLPMLFETWFSSEDVGAVLISRISEPRGSKTSLELSDVKFDEPAPGLFEQPANYRIVDETAAFTMVIGAAPAKTAPPNVRTFTALTGMPWSGELLSGTTILNRQYRDTMGRTRREPVGNVKGTIEIVDPVAGFRYSINTEARTARRTSIVAKSVPASSAKSPEIARQTTTLANGVTGLTEPLGTKTIDGIETWGQRTTLTYPPGSLGGNDKTFSTVNEAWMAPQLGVSLLMKNAGALVPESTTTITNLKYSEPDPALFQIPDGYQVIDGN